ncbi:fungal-specific transcription factor domain-containing protein [Lipomyces kononenkoae]
MADTLNSLQTAKDPIKPSRRRDKPQLSCTLCRRRKLKCDRQQPCEACVRRGLSLSCTYVPFQSKAPDGHDQSESLPVRTAAIQDRIGQLETLVTSLMNNLGESNHMPRVSAMEPDRNLTKDVSPLVDSFGHISLDSTETVYVDDNHWRAILDGIAELKESFESDSELGENNSNGEDRDSPDLIFGSCKRVDKHQILAAIPPKSIVDRLMAEYFNGMYIAPVIIHKQTFLKEYEEFWDHPLDSPVIWIGLFLAVLCLATTYHYQCNGPQKNDSDPKRAVDIYREKIVQCLILGRYTKCRPYTIETLLLYLHIEYLNSGDSQIEHWVLFGVTVRLALRMGYHRDPSHFTSISPFHGEMRRRVWMLLRQLDVLSAAEFGLPRMIRELQSDTADPRNLKDEDLYESMTELPPARPESDYTAVLFMVAKKKVSSVYGMICDITTATPPPPYAEVLRLDSILNDVCSALPESLQARPIYKSIMDSPELIISRIYISLLFSKAKCVLHRKYMLEARTDNRYFYSRTTCVNAALELLQLQSTLNEETADTSGRLYKDRWRVSSLIYGDFLMATSLLCLDISHDSSDESMSDFQITTGVDSDLRQRITQALEKSYVIWLQQSHSSKESQKAVDVLTIVLGKIKNTSMAMAIGTGSSTVDDTDNSSTGRSSSTPDFLNLQLPNETMYRTSNTYILPEDSSTWTGSLDTEAEFLGLYTLGFSYRSQSVNDNLEMTLG